MIELSPVLLKTLSQYRHLYIGFSGGLDSTVLLHYLSAKPGLYSKMTAVHIHHGLSPNANIWQAHCERVCLDLKIPYLVKTVEFNRDANIEEGARLARMDAFSSLLKDNDALILAHHQDDQAETLLLQLIRGAGVDGLAGMPFIKKLKQGALIRPLLAHSRATLETYAQQQGLIWISDESNQNERFSRNYVRHQIMPLLKKKWPSVVSNMARAAANCQQAVDNLDALAKIDAALFNPLVLTTIQTLPNARVMNVLRMWFKQNQVKMPSLHQLNRMVCELILSDKADSKMVAWGLWCVRRYQDKLYILQQPAKSFESVPWLNFPEDVYLPSLNKILKANPSINGLHIPRNSNVLVCNRKGKEQLRLHGQTKSLKKLLQTWKIPPWERVNIPLIYVNNHLAAVVGYAIDDAYYATSGDDVYSIVLM